jgi:recombination protein RecA
MSNDFFKKLQDSINKKMSGVHASTMSESDIITDRYSIKTPAYDLNRILSGSLKKGIPSRNLLALIGPEHSMKSSFMILCMAEAIRNGKKAIIIDTEGGVNKEFCERWGLDLDNVFYTYTPFVSEVRGILGQIRESEEKELIIGLDSVGGLDRLKQFEDAAKGEIHADQGLLQKEIRSMLKLFLNICIGQNSIGIATGHLYGAPSHLPLPDQIGGGKAMKMFPSVIVQLWKQNIYETPNNKKSKVIGSEIRATTIKNRMYPPFQSATVHLDYINGVQPYAGLLELGMEAGLIEKGGSWYTVGDQKYQGTENAMEGLKEIPDFIEKIDDFLKKTGYSTVNKELKAAEEMLAEEIEKEEKGEE